MCNLLPQPASADASIELLALGDCNTAGADVPIIQFAAEQLRAAGFACESLNWGLTMTTTREGLARVRRDRPIVDVAVINYGLVDSWVTTVPKLYVPYFPDTPSSRIARKLLKSFKRRLRSPWVRRWIPLGPVVPREEYESNLRQTLVLLRQFNPSLIAVIWSTSQVQNHTERNTWIDHYNTCLRSIARETGSVFIDTAEILERVAASDRFADGVHLSRRSCHQLGAAIAQSVLEPLIVARRSGARRSAA